jgi:hypothetical protein
VTVRGGAPCTLIALQQNRHLYIAATVVVGIRPQYVNYKRSLLGADAVDLGGLVTGVHAPLDAVRGKLLDGFRNLPKAERVTLAEIIIRVSGFAADQADIIAELDANPLLWHADHAGGHASRSDCGGVACFRQGLAEILREYASM